jgi:hypothetical protein
MPIFAEIGDKMPTLETMWSLWIVVGLTIAGFTVGIAAIRWRMAGFLVGGSFLLGVLAAWPDGTMDSAIVQELGFSYLLLQRLSGFVPFALTMIAWLGVRVYRRQSQ